MPSRKGRGKASGGRPPQVDVGVGASYAPVTLSYSMPGPDGTEDVVKVKISGPESFEAWVKTRHLYSKDKTTRKRELELVTYSDFINAYNNLEKDQKYLWMEHPWDGMAGRVGNMQCNLQNQATALEVKTTRALVTDEALKAKLGTTLTPVHDGRSVKFFAVTRSGNLRELIEVDGMGMNREDKVLVVNEAKMSPSDKDIGETIAKLSKLRCWLWDGKEKPDDFATEPTNVKEDLLGGIEWEVSVVMSGDNFTEHMEEECNDNGIHVVRSNGAGYAYSRPSSASSVATAPAGSPAPSRPSSSAYASGESSPGDGGDGGDGPSEESSPGDGGDGGDGNGD